MLTRHAQVRPGRFEGQVRGHPEVQQGREGQVACPVFEGGVRSGARMRRRHSCPGLARKANALVWSENIPDKEHVQAHLDKF